MLHRKNNSSNWTNSNDAAVCVDPSPYNTWNDWNANQRDLFILDRNGNFISQQNITSGVPSDLESTVIDLLTDETFQPLTKDNFKQQWIWIQDNETALANYGEISLWDVSLINDFSNLFLNKSSFNGNIGNWDVSNASNMSNMFMGASYFNEDISLWDVGNVTDMNSMFHEATNFNQDLSSWDVSNVTNMSLRCFVMQQILILM